MGLGTYLGYFVSQNGLGHVLGHVKDVGDDATQIDKVRIYRTTARQFFHADDGDLVGLLCVHRAAEGGESDLVSSHSVWNVLQAEYPDVAELLTRPVWYFDRKGEVSDGQTEWTRQPVFYLENGGLGRVYSKFDPYYVRSLTRFSDRGLVPPLSEEQQRAIRILEEVCNRLALHMILEVGDIQFLSNAHIFHARTAYKGKASLSMVTVVVWMSKTDDDDRLPSAGTSPPSSSSVAVHARERRRMGPAYAGQQGEEEGWHPGQRHGA